MITNILHLTTDSAIAGAETLLLEIARKHDRERFRHFFVTIKPEGRFHRSMRLLGMDAYSLGCLKMTDIPRAFFRLRELLRGNGIHILHTHLFHAGILGLLVNKLSPGPRVVMTRHYSDLLYIYGNFWEKFADRAVSRNTGAIIAVSDAVKRVMVEYDKIDPGKITVIHNGVDVDALSAENGDGVKRVREKYFPGDPPVVGAVGSLHPRKGHRYLLEAAQMIARENGDVKFLIVGDGELKNELVDFAGSMGLSGRVFFTGHCDRVSDYIANMDIFVQPSVEEGFGITILEAMALGKPVIGTRIGGIPEIIKDGTTGILVSPKDPAAIAQAVFTLLSDRSKARRMGEEARETVKKEFSIEGMVKKYEKFYGSLLGGG